MVFIRKRVCIKGPQAGTNLPMAIPYNTIPTTNNSLLPIIPGNDMSKMLHSQHEESGPSLDLCDVSKGPIRHMCLHKPTNTANQGLLSVLAPINLTL